MAAYVVRRLAQSAAVLILLTVCFFLLLSYVSPYGPCLSFEARGSVSCIHVLHLDAPLIDRYVSWLSSYLHGNFGYSATGVPVASLLLQKLPATILLVTVAFLAQQMIALPLGALAAWHRYSLFDHLFTLASYAALSVPAFVFGLALLWLFAVIVPVFPASRTVDTTLPLFWSAGWFTALGQEPGLVLGDLARHLALPAFTLMAVGVAVDSRLMRAVMADVIHQDYIRSARAKGLQRRTVIFKHAFRNALLPIITNMALYLPLQISAIVVVETVFTWEGIGYTFTQALQQQDLPTVQAALLLSGVVAILANLMADLAYGLVDPRIRYG